MTKARNIVSQHGPRCAWWGDMACDCSKTAEDNRRLLQGLLREALVKLRDVQGAYATKEYATLLILRIEAALGEAR